MDEEEAEEGEEVEGEVKEEEGAEEEGEQKVEDPLDVDCGMEDEMPPWKRRRRTCRPEEAEEGEEDEGEEKEGRKEGGERKRRKSRRWRTQATSTFFGRTRSQVEVKCGAAATSLAGATGHVFALGRALSHYRSTTLFVTFSKDVITKHFRLILHCLRNAAVSIHHPRYVLMAP